MTTLFISDLHLSADQESIVQLFCRFLEKEAPLAERLYILGDLFEYWIGDDYIEPGLECVIESLKRLTGRGIAVDVMHGNRDFLLGSEFERLSGCRLIRDPSVIDLYGTPTLLMHGDSMCIDDVEYMQMRKDFRDPATQKFLLSKPVEERLQIARNLREKSREASSYKSEEIMDVNQQYVAEIMQKWQVSRLIHGHTHRPAFHDFTIENTPAQRIVLGDWYEQGSVLRCDATECLSETLPLA